MNLVSEYKRQFGWRDWSTILNALPPLQNQVVLDLGCGVGDLAAELANRGARVIGFDMNEQLLQQAESTEIPNAEFRLHDLRRPIDVALTAHGLWSSYSAAYFPNLPTTLAAWANSLKPGGWVALTEIDDFFGHEPLSDRTKATLDAFAQDALTAGRYDFHMGRKLRGYLEQSGFTVTKTLTPKDQELSFDGPARPDVLDAWRARFDRMKVLREFCGTDFNLVREEFLECLTRADHRSIAKVFCCIAIK